MLALIVIVMIAVVIIVSVAFATWRKRVAARRRREEWLGSTRRQWVALETPVDDRNSEELFRKLVERHHSAGRRRPQQKVHPMVRAARRSNGRSGLTAQSWPSLPADVLYPGTSGLLGATEGDGGSGFSGGCGDAPQGGGWSDNSGGSD